MTRWDQAHSESKPGLGSSSRGHGPAPHFPAPRTPWVVHKPHERIRATELAGEARKGEPRREGAESPPGQARTHFAESVLMEPVTSMSPARNSWYLVQAMAADAGSAKQERDLRARLRWYPQTGHPRGLRRECFRAGSHMT